MSGAALAAMTAECSQSSPARERRSAAIPRPSLMISSEVSIAQRGPILSNLWAGAVGPEARPCKGRSRSRIRRTRAAAALERAPVGYIEYNSLHQIQHCPVIIVSAAVISLRSKFMALRR